MGIADQFKNYAMDFAENAIQRVAELDRKLAEIEVERAQIEAERQSAGNARQRLANYPVKLGSDYQCPCCWVSKGAMAPLRPIPSETGDDLFRCQLCHFDFPIEN